MKSSVSESKPFQSQNSRLTQVGGWGLGVGGGDGRLVSD